MTVTRTRLLVTASRAVVGLACWGLLSAWTLQSLCAQVPTGPAQNVLAGSRIFGTKGCFACHAIDGFGGTRGPDLARGQPSPSFYGLAAAMWNHLPTMMSQMRELRIDPPNLDPWEMADLVAFLFWLGYVDPAGDADAGAQAFAAKGCVVCHQVRGVGGVVGPNLDFLGQYGTPIQIATGMWNHGPAMAEELSRAGVTRPTFSSSELTDLIAYLSAANRDVPGGPMYVLPGRADQGREWFEEKNCVECHGTPGSGGGIAPDLAGRGRPRSLMEFAAAMWNKGARMMRAMRTADIPVPELRPAEMADIVAYLYSVRYFQESGDPSRGRRRLQGKGCLGCHALSGRGGSTGPDLARVRGLGSPAAVIAALWNHAAIENLSGSDAVMWPTMTSLEMAEISAFLQTAGRSR